MKQKKNEIIKMNKIGRKKQLTNRIPNRILGIKKNMNKASNQSQEEAELEIFLKNSKVIPFLLRSIALH